MQIMWYLSKILPATPATMHVKEFSVTYVSLPDIWGQTFCDEIQNKTKDVMMRMEAMKQSNRISRETVMSIAGRELPRVEKIHLWVFSAFSYEEGIPVYRLKAYADLTAYDIILDARNGNVLKRTERCP